MPEDNALRSWHFRQLKWSLQSLAHAGSPQRLLFPDQTVNADDLAFEFDHWSSMVCRTYEADLSSSQRDALGAIAGKLATMSRDGAEFDLDLWTDAALGASEHWAEIRKLAAAALDAFGWTAEATDVGTSSAADAS